MSDFYQRIERSLNDRRKSGNYRQLNIFEGFTDFFSNDYLGFGKDSSIKAKKVSFQGSARLIAGNSLIHEELERTSAHRFGGEKALLFNSGYTANLGILSAIPEKGDLILYDSESHASVREGVRLSRADAYKFNHNDTTDLTKKLQKFPNRTIFVFVESIYSMSGDIAPLQEIADLCIKHGALLIVDEAHGAGVFGCDGSGLSSHIESSSFFLKIITFGKAFGSHGAVVTGKSAVIDYLINFSRPFIYTTALPQLLVEHTLNQISREDINERRKELNDRISYFNRLFKSSPYLGGSSASPIKPFYINNQVVLKEIEDKLHVRKMGVKAIYPPTVAPEKQCLRISLHAHNTEQEIDLLAELLL
ncbi:MAG: 8-amino-7-oxononanoate synthase [Brumimicrobium sp.]|nr:8-amino-7-oxononanoate synthase [Brumimicrobium sp.]